MNFAQVLRETTAAVRLRHRKLGVRKSLTQAQRKKAADVFAADVSTIAASKQLLNIKHKAYRKVAAVRTAATSYWKSVTVIYPDAGVRLIKRDKIDSFNDEMIKFREALEAAVSELEAEYGELKDTARERLADLYDKKDYPSSLAEEFSLEWEYPSIEPDEYLKTNHPDLYAAEQSRVA